MGARAKRGTWTVVDASACARKKKQFTARKSLVVCRLRGRAMIFRQARERERLCNKETIISFYIISNTFRDDYRIGDGHPLVGYTGVYS